MLKDIRVLSLPLLFLTVLLKQISGFSFDNCQRLYFNHSSESRFPFVHLLDAVYVKQYERDGLPVYKDERGDIYFSGKRNWKRGTYGYFFSIGSEGYKDYTGLTVSFHEEPNKPGEKHLVYQFNSRYGRLKWTGTECAGKLHTPAISSHHRNKRSSFWNDDIEVKPPVVDRTDLSVAIRVLVFLIPIFILPLSHCIIFACCTGFCPSFKRTLSKQAYVGILIWLFYIIIYKQTDISKYGPVSFKFIFWVAIAYIVVGYLFVIIDSFYWASEVKYFDSKLLDGAASQRYIKSLMGMPPKITIHMECYHINEIREIIHRDGAGNIIHRSVQRSEMIQTWSGRQRVHFSHWIDRSDTAKIPKIGDAKSSYLGVNLKTKIRIADAATKQAFDAIKTTFINNNKHRDHKYRCYLTEEISGGVQKKLMIYDENQGLPILMDKRFYALCSFLMCSWPYRILMKRSISEGKFKLVKFISNSPFDIRPPHQQTTTAESINNDGILNTSETTQQLTPEEEHSLEDAPPSYETVIKPPDYETLQF